MSESILIAELQEAIAKQPWHGLCLSLPPKWTLCQQGNAGSCDAPRQVGMLSFGFVLHDDDSCAVVLAVLTPCSWMRP